jgi:hypothetical protein
MKPMKSFKPKTDGNVLGATGRVLGVSIPMTMVLSAVLAMGFAIALDGCSSKETSAKATPTQSSGNQSAQPIVAPTPQPSPAVEASTPDVPKKKVRRAATMKYSNPNYGVSFRYPGYYKLMPQDTAALKSVWPDPAPSNFAQPGGVTVATLAMPSHTAPSFFQVSVNKDVSREQCGQFASPTPAEVETNLPVDTSDVSIPSKTSVRGVEFMKVENATEQNDVQFYHHFEPGSPTHEGVVGTCYEFALGVQAPLDDTRPVDYVTMFDRMQRILATVKIKPETLPTVTASVPERPPSSNVPQ